MGLGGIRGVWPSWSSLALPSEGTVFAGTGWFPSSDFCTLWFAHALVGSRDVMLTSWDLSSLSHPREIFVF